MFNERDIQQLGNLGITEQTVKNQLDCFAKGFPYLNIVAPALVGKGITVLNSQQQAEHEQLYNSYSGTRLKFVPASGAATRMFKHLFEYKDAAGKVDLNDPKHKALKEFFDRLKEFAFYDSLKRKLTEQGIDVDNLKPEQYLTIVAALLDESGLNYGQLPKAMLKFHKYPAESRTAIEEHLVEAALYARDTIGDAKLHFTVSPEHQEGLDGLIRQVLLNYEEHFGTHFQITFSEQKKATDTIAVDLNNQPFRNADGTLLFRPGGHGALIDNLNEQNEDLVFIKNIDNIVPETKVGETVRWKKILAGTLVACSDRIHSYLHKMDNGERDAKLLKEVSDFLQSVLCISVPDSLSGEGLVAFLYQKLDRPIRVCGMVKNEGEPGGGPFLVKEDDGSTSLQILESSQIDMKNERMKACFDAATHFNPVDLVCAFHNHKGEKYDLHKFVDPKTGFISEKSKDGKPLKAQELPGLWNGAMSRWNTIFVEVPLATFNPVKTVNDLLRKEHQA